MTLIRGRWTIRYVTATRTQGRGNAIVSGPPVIDDRPVEVVPVPDEAAVERGAEALSKRFAELAGDEDADAARELAEAVLRAALEPPK